MRKPKFFESPYLNMRIFTGITMGNSCYEIEISWDDNITKMEKSEKSPESWMANGESHFTDYDNPQYIKGSSRIPHHHPPTGFCETAPV